MAPAENRTLYRIQEGVHRCVAAYLTGQATVAAQVDTGGILGPEIHIPIDVIYSPKSEISRWDHNRDFHELSRLTASDADRADIPPVELVVVPDWVAKRMTPVSCVVVHAV